MQLSRKSKEVLSRTPFLRTDCLFSQPKTGFQKHPETSRERPHCCLAEQSLLRARRWLRAPAGPCRPAQLRVPRWVWLQHLRAALHTSSTWSSVTNSAPPVCSTQEGDKTYAVYLAPLWSHRLWCLDEAERPPCIRFLRCFKEDQSTFSAQLGYAVIMESWAFPYQIA